MYYAQFKVLHGLILKMCRHMHCLIRTLCFFYWLVFKWFHIFFVKSLKPPHFFIVFFCVMILIACIERQLSKAAWDLFCFTIWSHWSVRYHFYGCLFDLSFEFFSALWCISLFCCCFKDWYRGNFVHAASGQSNISQYNLLYNAHIGDM